VTKAKKRGGGDRNCWSHRGGVGGGENLSVSWGGGGDQHSTAKKETSPVKPTARGGGEDKGETVRLCQNSKVFFPERNTNKKQTNDSRPNEEHLDWQQEHEK